VTPEAVAAELNVLASRVRRMSPPLARHPERFHEERSDIAHDLAELARRVAPRSRRATAVEVDISERRRGRIVVVTQTINGKRVVVQRRRAFAVYVGERPVKKP
jgi:hypothetical protein